MVDILIYNISQLIRVKDDKKGPKIGEEMLDLGVIESAAIAICDGRIIDVGKSEDLFEKYVDASNKIDASGCIVLPGFVDAHTHLPFIGTREDEFLMRLKGVEYIEILKAGGGILNTVEKVRSASKEELFKTTIANAFKLLSSGITTAEAKSGYGLNLEDEIKQLEVLRDINLLGPLEVIPTFLGAHAIPKEYKNDRKGYIELLKNVALPEVVSRGLAVYCDVFCDEGVFSIEETEEILTKAKELGLKLRIHADEIAPVGGAELAANLGAKSAEHLIKVSDRGIEMMAEKGVFAVLLPGTSFSLRKPYAPARKFISAGVPVALGTDFNPGSCYCSSMEMVLQLAVLAMGMLPEEAIVASTLNSAYSVDIGDKVGSIDIGKQADITIMDVPKYAFLFYEIGRSHVKTVIKKGRIVYEAKREYS
ncbi:MAG: imidazolonepropionase [Synergistetes bacterium]|nr:imidazolonepropionase [Synergistota bacterium]MCX8127232.1 imidazolonepropionase [Synergistota bacterium]MDW8191882.1 imidazolonepropionase [Synergistota bacterium]